MPYLIDLDLKLDSFRLRIRLDSCRMSAGSILGLVGPSGSGKTMTLRCIAGISRPDRGRIVVDGKTFYDSEKGICLTPQERRVGFLFQNYALFPNMTVLENVRCGALGARMQAAGRSASARQERDPKGEQRRQGWRARRDRDLDLAREAIRRVRLEGLEDRRPVQLSGGQQQRCALARILAGSPDLVLLDEPFSALDEYLRDQVLDQTMSLLEDLKIPVFFVTHSRQEARRACSDLAILAEGKIQETGRTEDLFRSPSSEWGRLLLGDPWMGSCG